MAPQNERRTEYDDPRAGAVATGRPADGPLSSGWVPARDGRAEIMPREPAGMQAWAPPPPVTGDSVWQPAESVSEIGTPIHRAAATLVRAAPLIVLALPATMGLIWLLGAGWAWLLPLWGGLSILAYLALVWVDLTFNAPSATERHRINRAAALKKMELEHTYSLRRMVIESYLRHMEGRDS